MTQNVVPTQETPCRSLLETADGADHDEPFHDTTASLPGAMAMQKLAEVHDTAATSPPSPDCAPSAAGVLHWLPLNR